VARLAGKIGAEGVMPSRQPLLPAGRHGRPERLFTTCQPFVLRAFAFLFLKAEIELMALNWRLLGVWPLGVLLAAFCVHAALAQAAPPAGRVLAAAGKNLSLPTAHPRILLVDAAYKASLQQRLKARTPAAVRFEAWVAAEVQGAKQYLFEPWHAALLGQLTGEERYARFAVAQTDAFVKAEEALIQRGERPLAANDSYLEVGQHIGNLALVYDWCFELLTPAQKARWSAYANQAVSNVWNHKTARWGTGLHPWTGWSVDNPANNYYYSFLRATMLLGLATHGENPMAEPWLQMFRQTKMEQQLLPSFARDLQGGGSREGTGYGTALKGLFQLFDWWRHSTGEALAERNGHALASIAHLLHSVTPTLDRLAPTGDHARDSKAQLFDYHREYLLVLMALFPQHPLVQSAGDLLARSSVPRMKHGFSAYVDFLYEPAAARAGALGDLGLSYWAPGTGQLMMRSSWETFATYANFICGPYSESHAHRDQGSFVLFKRQWLAQDSNLEAHSGLEQGEEMHNLVRFEKNGQTVKQTYNTSCELQGLVDNELFVHASARLTPVYRGKSAVSRVEREFFFFRPNTVVVFDRATVASEDVRRIWSLNLPSLPTSPKEPFTFGGAGSTLELHRLLPLNPQLQWVEGTVVSMPGATPTRAGIRLDIAHQQGTQSLFLNLLSLDGAARQVQRMEAPEQAGVRWQLEDGRRVQVMFSTQGAGGRVELRHADGTLQWQSALPTQVAPPPLMRAATNTNKM
jgi:hypothetical protein